MSKPVITVDPVVVMPDIASKKESVKERSIALNLNGKAEIRDSDNHTDEIRMNACFTLILWARLALLRISDPPKKAVMTMQSKKTFQSGLPK